MITLHIKNMVCNRCKMVVKAELERLDLHPTIVELGEVTLAKVLAEDEKSSVAQALESMGFELIDDKKGRLIEKIKTLIIELIHQHNSDLKINLSHFLSEQIGNEYNYLSSLFSEVEGTTIEKYFIAQKIERVKELLVYDELSLSEIAFKLNYSSVAHLSNQFKKVTGLTPSYFKHIKKERRKPLDEV